MTAYADTSFWVSFYTTDAHSARADALVGKFNPVWFTAFTRHELRNAIRLCAFRRQISPAELEAVLRALADDQTAGLLHEQPLVWPRVLEEAEALSARHTVVQGHRGMDILHVAVARSIGAREFLTFDERQAQLAKEAGLAVPR